MGDLFALADRLVRGEPLRTMTKHDVQGQLRATTEKGYNFKDVLSRAQQGFASMTEMPSGDIILDQRDTGESVIEVRLEGETVWVT